MATITEKIAALRDDEPYYSFEFFPPKTDSVRPTFYWVKYLNCGSPLTNNDYLFRVFRI